MFNRKFKLISVILQFPKFTNFSWISFHSNIMNIINNCNNKTLHFPYQLALETIPLQNQQISPKSGNQLNDLLQEFISYFGAPKSKITRARKRRGHLRYIPDRIGWIQCVKCGEPKRPHRMCTKHMDICAIRDSEWLKSNKSKAEDYSTLLK